MTEAELLCQKFAKEAEEFRAAMRELKKEIEELERRARVLGTSIQFLCANLEEEPT